MGIRDNIRNFFYAVTHANQLVESEKALRVQVSELRDNNNQLIHQQVAKTAEADKFRECTRTALKVLLPDQLSWEEVKSVYDCFRESDTRNACQKEMMKFFHKYGFLARLNYQCNSELLRMVYTNTLIDMQLLPETQRFSAPDDKVKQAVHKLLCGPDFPRDIPVGKIEYLALDGKTAEAVEYYDAFSFLEQISDDNHCGVPMSISVYKDPVTGKHMDTDWTEDLDPMPQGFCVSDYTPEPGAPVLSKDDKAPAPDMDLPAIHHTLDGCDIPGILKQLTKNAWESDKTHTVYIHANEHTIRLAGYIYEPGYEYFSATASISLNGQILYGIDSRNVAPYKNETHHMGIYGTPEDAIAHLKKVVQSQSYLLTDNPLVSTQEFSEATRKKDLNNQIQKAEGKQSGAVSHPGTRPQSPQR